MILCCTANEDKQLNIIMSDAESFLIMWISMNTTKEGEGDGRNRLYYT